MTSDPAVDMSAPRMPLPTNDCRRSATMVRELALPTVLMIVTDRLKIGLAIGLSAMTMTIIAVQDSNIGVIESVSPWVACRSKGPAGLAVPVDRQLMARAPAVWPDEISAPVDNDR